MTRPTSSPGAPRRAAPETRSVLLAIACGLSLSVLFHCSVPAKQAQDDPPSIQPGGPDKDAGRDADSKEVGLEAGVDADTRRASCGSNTCNPDKSDERCPPLGASGAAGAPSQTCRVTRSTTVVGDRVATCGAVGTVVEQGACQSQADCAADLACIGALGSTAGTCRPYCCYGQTSCNPGTYCSLVRAFEIGPTPDPLFLPACVVPDNCRLLEPTACDGDNVCTYLDGVTICYPPGGGKDGEPCGCASGYVCLKSTNSCRRICHQGADSECGGGSCISGGANFPEGFGVCSK